MSKIYTSIYVDITYVNRAGTELNQITFVPSLQLSARDTGIRGDDLLIEYFSP